MKVNGAGPGIGPDRKSVSQESAAHKRDDGLRRAQRGISRMSRVKAGTDRATGFRGKKRLAKAGES